MQAKERRAFNVKRMLCIGGSVVAIVLLILLMTGSASKPGSGKLEDLRRQPGAPQALKTASH